MLVAKKNQAVAVEDFDSAMDLKEISDKLKLIGSDLIMLEARKTEAIQGEDFETAKALKIQIARLKELVDNLDPENPFAPPAVIPEADPAEEQAYQTEMEYSAQKQPLNPNDERPLPTLAKQQRDQTNLEEGMSDMQYGTAEERKKVTNEGDKIDYMQVPAETRELPDLDTLPVHKNRPPALEDTGEAMPRIDSAEGLGADRNISPSP